MGWEITWAKENKRVGLDYYLGLVFGFGGNKDPFGCKNYTRTNFVITSKLRGSCGIFPILFIRTIFANIE